ncbi:MAG: protein-L-isoaspartate O-methyltransferase family protein [Nanoarchaeota archaeon]
MDKVSMISSVAASLDEGERKEDILDAMMKVDRKHFLDDPHPYEDMAQPIGEGQTISQPSTVGVMLQLAAVERGQSILEVGSGSGWNACLLAYLAAPGDVLSVDVKASLVERAKKNKQSLEQQTNLELSNLRFEKKNVIEIEGSFDRVIITAGIMPDQEEMADKLAARLLKDEGLLLCPQSSGPMLIVRKEGSILRSWQTKEQFAFVPLLLGDEGSS